MRDLSQVAGRIPSKGRSFEKVVEDVRCTVFSVIRTRPIPGGRFAANTLGSGFFISPTVFLTCHHVINHVGNPHQDGDRYELVNNLGQMMTWHALPCTINDNLFLYPEKDLALIVCPSKPSQPYVSLEYGEILQGKEIGVAGYPLPKLNVDPSGQLMYNTLLYRVAKGVITAQYVSNLTSDNGILMPNLPVIEVNFLFVAGNSGGPIFDSATGRVMAFVHGYTAEKIREALDKVSMIQNIPEEKKDYVQSVHAIYSLGILLSHVRTELETLGVTL